KDADVRQQLMLHGLFHRIQPELGLITDDGFNEHLGTLEGRVWMRLEWRALRRAVEASGSDRAEAIADALAFRRERRRRFPGAAATNRPPTTDVAMAAARYDAETLRTAEEARDRTQQVRVAELRRRFVEGPVLTMPAAGSGTSETTGSVGIPGAGTVLFRNFTQSGQWGRLDANDGVLRSADGATLSVPVTGRLEGTTLK